MSDSSADTNELTTKESPKVTATASLNLEQSGQLFRETVNILPTKPDSRRKWDAAVVADLDQDGLQDMLLTEHGKAVELYWNNGGVFSEPVKVISGDTHGVAAADYDNDGLVELMISQGGGGGKKPRYPIEFEVSKDRKISKGKEFPLYQRTRGRAAKMMDADQDGDVEMVFSAFPLKSQPKGANYFYQNEQGKLIYDSILPQAKWLGYKMTVTDINNDGDPDVIFHGGDNIVAAVGGEGLSFSDQSKQVLGELADTTKVRSIAEIDFDNDGDMDLFLTRSKHQFYEERFYDEQNKRFAFFVRRQTFQFDDLTIDGDFILENLQMAYPHFDVFVGSNKTLVEFDAERSGERNLTLMSEQAKGWPQVQDKKGLYIGYLGNGVWRVGGETTSPTAGVIHNVVSRPSVIEPDLLPAKLLENRDGKFVDVTEQLGINIPEQTVSAVAGDFDNDGWSDLFVVRVGNMATENQQILLLNQQGKSFKLASAHGLVSKELGATGGGAELIDYDIDGDLDIIYNNERGRWHLYTNQLNNDNHFITVNVGHSPNKRVIAQGAKLQLKACGNNYVRIVGATSSPFSQGNNNQLHIGLGACSKVDSATISWSNGERQLIDVKKLNSTILVGS
ncbi:CRTAC1 family protein [Paraglaciecola arctica]|uniref:CRTAC1 family protein n=1 Tax=Paraglaciecola arctica TaxID=1128911 RepID=UPI001C076375|nr:CRTAC1 family protein [Paraglaciecola arctica]MBU3005278.1 CRTAC1 family protein [Paraglaciecola arctica]